MPEFIQTLLSPGSFIPHGHCYLWQTPLVWLHLLSDGLTALSYYSIPIFLIALAYQRQDLPFRWAFWLFGAFIVSCGTTHWLEMVTLWYPVYWISGAVKAATALVSMWTALSLIPLFPQALALPNPAQLRQMNQLLQQEIEERKSIEEELRRRKAQLLEAQEVAHIGSWELDLPTGQVNWSDEIFRIFGLTPGQPEPDYKQHLEQNFFPEDGERLRQAVNRALEYGEPYTLDLQIIRTDGSTGWVLGKGKTILNTQGQITRLVGIALDITERKQIEAEQQKLAQMKDDFLSAVSHELRSPLASIKMAAHLLELILGRFSNSQETIPSSFPTVQVKQYLSILNSQCEQELQLVNDLLELQRLETNVVQVNRVEINLYNWLPQVIAPYYERSNHRHQTLQVNLTPGLPCLISDPEILTHVLNELLTNACKYTPPHEVITVEVESSDSYLQLVVSNSGVEIAASDLNRIFERFYRIPHSDRWNQGGTGLGLALAEQKVNCLGGSIQVSSETGTVRFVIQLPFH